MGMLSRLKYVEKHHKINEIRGNGQALVLGLFRGLNRVIWARKLLGFIGKTLSYELYVCISCFEVWVVKTSSRTGKTG